MRAWFPAICVLGLASVAFAQVPPEAVQPPQQELTQPAPPPVMLLPPSASDTPPASSDVAAKPATPLPRPRRVAAIIQALDKTTAETMRFAVPINQPVRYKDLVFIVHVCEDSAPDQGQRGAAAHLEIDSQPRPIPGRVTPPTRQLFKGWMFASAPGLHPFEHPVYDAWLLACKAS